MKAFERRGLRRLARAISCVLRVALGARLLRARHVADDVWPTRYGSLPASHSFGWPGAAVFGYGLVCRWLSSVGPLAGRRRRAALVVRALRRGDDDEPLPGAVACRPRSAARRCCGRTASRSCRPSGSARGSRASGRRDFTSWSVDLMPRGTSGSLENVCSSCSSDSRRWFSGGVLGSTSMPAPSASRERGRGGAQRADAGLQLAHQALGVGQERPLARHALDARVQRRLARR